MSERVPSGTFVNRCQVTQSNRGRRDATKSQSEPDCAECHGTGIIVCDHGGDGRFVVEQKCECVTELPWYAINDPGAESEV